MLWKKTPVNPPALTSQALIESAVQEINYTYGSSGNYVDHFTKSRLVRTSINHEIDLLVEFPPAFPAVAPIIRISSGTSSEFLQALEEMSGSGLMDADGTVNYQKCFFFGPEMKISNLIFLVGIILRTCHIVASNRAATRPAQTETFAIPKTPVAEQGTMLREAQV